MAGAASRARERRNRTSSSSKLPCPPRASLSATHTTALSSSRHRQGAISTSEYGSPKAAPASRATPPRRTSTAAGDVSHPATTAGSPDHPTLTAEASSRCGSSDTAMPAVASSSPTARCTSSSTTSPSRRGPARARDRSRTVSRRARRHPSRVDDIAHPHAAIGGPPCHEHGDVVVRLVAVREPLHLGQQPARGNPRHCRRERASALWRRSSPNESPCRFWASVRPSE